MIKAAARSNSEMLVQADDLSREGRFEEAIQLVHAEIDSKGSCAPAYRLLARIQNLRGDPGGESAALESLLAFEPDNGAIWTRVGAIALEYGQADKACRAYQRAARVLPEQFSSWHGLAQAALSANRLPVVQHAARELLRRFPGRAESHLIAGHLAKAAGSAVNAIAAFEQALKVDATSSEAVFNLVELSAPSSATTLSNHIARAVAHAPTSGFDAANLGFARASIENLAGDYGAAFEHYASANRAAADAMQQRGIVYQPDKTAAWVDATINKYPAATFKCPLDASPTGLRLILIVGMPRSGTTLVEQILASHSRIMGGGELPIAVDCERRFNMRRAELGCRGPVDPTDSRERELIEELREIYVDRLLERDLDGDFITDKLPGNFARLGFIRLLFPDSVIVHCRRHPIATCWSLFTSNFSIHDPYYNSLEHLAHYYRCYRRLIGHWHGVLQPAPLELDYEELVLHPLEQSQRLIAAVGVDWDERCLAFHENRRAVFTASQRQVRKPIYETSLNHWRHYECYLDALKSLEPSGSRAADHYCA